MSEKPLQTDPLTAPWSDLYGAGSGKDTFDRVDPVFEPLLMAIEKAIVAWCDANGKTGAGGSIGVTIKQLSMSHETPTADPLSTAVLTAIRRCLTSGNFSRHDVKGALRAVARSIEGHTRESGPSGYINFVREFLKQ